MAAVIATERRLRTGTPGRKRVVQNVVNWRTVRGCGPAVAGKLRLVVLEQIADHFRRERIKKTSVIQVSHETIYRSLFVQTRGVLKKEAA